MYFTKELQKQWPNSGAFKQLKNNIMNYTKEEAKEIEKLKEEKVNILITVEAYNDRVSKLRKMSGRPDYLKLV